MTKKKLLKLAEVKTQLSNKYIHLSKLASSDAKREKFRRQAADFLHQAKTIRIEAEQ